LAPKHYLDQLFRVEEGSGEAVMDGVQSPIRARFAVLVPADTKHSIINTGAYTLYAPWNHRDGVVHHTRADAEADIIRREDFEISAQHFFPLAAITF